MIVGDDSTHSLKTRFQTLLLNRHILIAVWKLVFRFHLHYFYGRTHGTNTLYGYTFIYHKWMSPRKISTLSILQKLSHFPQPLDLRQAFHIASDHENAPMQWCVIFRCNDAYYSDAMMHHLHSPSPSIELKRHGSVTTCIRCEYAFHFETAKW